MKEKMARHLAGHQNSGGRVAGDPGGCCVQDTFASDEMTAALLGFSARFQEQFGAKQAIASPLGAWMLLALAATAARDDARRELAVSLGMDVGRAAQLVGAMLGESHPAVACACALWTAARFDTERLREWRAHLPRDVARGPMPSPDEADRWAHRVTAGQISRFPGRIERETAIMLATALSVRSGWKHPYEIDPVARFGRARAGAIWDGAVQEVLTDTAHAAGAIVRTDEAGDVAVHWRDTDDELRVFSVIAERDVAARDVLAAAHRIASESAPTWERFAPTGTRSLYDLPLGDAPLWSLDERTTTRGGRHETFGVILPEWRIESRYDLGKLPLGFPAAATAIAELLGAPPLFAARQVAVARYFATGFEASAISSLGVFGLSRVKPRAPDPGVERHALLTFGHPYAVVALALDGPLARIAPGDPRTRPWHRLPIFSAWVTEPREPERPSVEEE